MTLDENGDLFTIRATYKKVTMRRGREAAARFRAMMKHFLNTGRGNGGFMESFDTPCLGTMILVFHNTWTVWELPQQPMPWGPINSVTHYQPRNRI
jgi:hypothetical protein